MIRRNHQPERDPDRAIAGSPSWAILEGPFSFEEYYELRKAGKTIIKEYKKQNEMNGDEGYFEAPADSGDLLIEPYLGPDNQHRFSIMNSLRRQTLVTAFGGFVMLAAAAGANVVTPNQLPAAVREEETSIRETAELPRQDQPYNPAAAAWLLPGTRSVVIVSPPDETAL